MKYEKGGKLMSINFYAPINNLGYGVHSYNLLKSLDKLVIAFALFPPNNITDCLDTIIEKWVTNQKKFNKNDIGVMIFHEQFMNRFYGKLRIGFPVFELDLLPEDIEKLKTLDYILQTSEYFKSYLNSIGFNNVFVVPEGFNPDIYNFDNSIIQKKEKLLNDHGLIFSHIGKMEERKSTLDIVNVFTQALHNSTNKCTLILNVVNPFLSNWLDLLSSFIYSIGYIKLQEDESTFSFVKDNLKLIVLKYKLKNIREIYDSSVFGLYLSKAEGWNLPLIESIASGLPCVTTNNTGMSDYLKEYPSEFIVQPGQSTVANDGVWFRGNRGNWVCPDLGSAKQILRSIASNPFPYLHKIKDCYNSIKNFTWEMSAQKFISVMKQVGGI